MYGLNLMLNVFCMSVNLMVKHGGGIIIPLGCFLAPRTMSLIEGHIARAKQQQYII